jgi:hypothetical protein
MQHITQPAQVEWLCACCLAVAAVEVDRFPIGVIDKDAAYRAAIEDHKTLRPLCAATKGYAGIHIPELERIGKDRG